MLKATSTTSMEASVVLLQLQDDLAGPGIPEERGLVEGAGGQDPAVGREGQADHGASVSPQVALDGPPLQVPDHDDAAVCRRQPLAIAAEGQRGHVRSQKVRARTLLFRWRRP